MYISRSSGLLSATHVTSQIMTARIYRSVESHVEKLLTNQKQSKNQFILILVKLKLLKYAITTCKGKDRMITLVNEIYQLFEVVLHFMWATATDSRLDFFVTDWIFRVH